MGSIAFVAWDVTGALILQRSRVWPSKHGQQNERPLTVARWSTTHSLIEADMDGILTLSRCRPDPFDFSGSVVAERKGSTVKNALG